MIIMVSSIIDQMSMNIINYGVRITNIGTIIIIINTVDDNRINIYIYILYICDSYCLVPNITSHDNVISLSQDHCPVNTKLL